MLCGIDQLFSGPQSAVRRRLRGSRVGVLTHAAAVDRRARHALSVLEELGAQLSVIFSPEHGLDGVAQAEEAVTPGGDGRAPAPVVSLYGASKDSLVPKSEDLGRVDVLVVDVADVGSRYYTYVWSALMAARAAAQNGVHTIVLDRPNPISGDPATVEGAAQQPGFQSFVGLEPLPIRHALTVGEILAHFLESDGLVIGPEGAVSVVTTLGWERHRTAHAWGRPFVMPSPNMPTVETALVYPGGCLLEGTNLSEGRGTTAPFQIVGAPWLDGRALVDQLAGVGLLGAQIRPIAFRPTFDKHAGEVCHGAMVHVTDSALFRPVATYLALLTLARKQNPERFAFRTTPYEFESDVPAFDLLTGSSVTRTAIAADASVEDVVALVAPVDPGWREVVAQAEARLARARA